jgi:hypothetical protein
MTATGPESSNLSWHDCHIWSIEIRAGEPEEDDWTSDLVFDIDYIVAWSCGVDGQAEFQVAPATLAFHGVTAPRFDIESPDRDFQIALGPLSIDRLEREIIAQQKVFLDRPYYRWTIRLNSPPAGEISFGAHGFTQTLWCDPIVTQRQHLTLGERRRLLSGVRDAAC